VYIGRAQVNTFSLIADMNYVGDNAPRLSRALFEIALRNQWTLVVERMLTVRLAAITKSLYRTFQGA
jgi:activating signal cointegrator complex subunit 3